MPTALQTAVKELEAAAAACEEAAAVLDRDPFDTMFRRLQDAVKSIGDVASGSWYGYQARCYGEKFAPARRPFSLEWGILGGPPTSPETYQRGRGGWHEYSTDEVVKEILRRAELESLDPLEKAADTAKSAFVASHREIMTTLDAMLFKNEEPALKEIRDKVRAIEPYETVASLANRLAPARVMTRDERAQPEGMETPPHVKVRASFSSWGSCGSRLKGLAALARQAVAYLKKRGEPTKKAIPGFVWAGVWLAAGALGQRYWSDALGVLRLAAHGNANAWLILIAALLIGVAVTFVGIAGNLIAADMAGASGWAVIRRSTKAQVLLISCVVFAALAWVLGRL